MMDVTSEEPMAESHSDQYPLLMEPHTSQADEQHIIDIERGSEASSSESSSFEFSRGSNSSNDGRPMSSMQVPLNESSSISFSRTNPRSSSSTRAEGIGRRNWSPFSSGLWISTELVFTLNQIIASMAVLCLSRNENPRAPLYAWVVGYTVGCFASLPILYWRFLTRNQSTEEVAVQSTQASYPAELSGESSYVTISLTPSSEQEDHFRGAGTTYEGQTTSNAFTSISLIMDHLKMALDCFFAVWFIVGNVWIFGGHASAADAPNLYRLCIVYLTLSCIGYAMPFILCAMICCCLPCIISVLGIREELCHGRGASEEVINALQTYKFNVKKGDGGCIGEPDCEDVGGILAGGTEKERPITKEDAVCCICLARYVNDDELRELPCSHFFHTECVDKWLKINATCPLCKSEIIEQEKKKNIITTGSSQTINMKC